LTLPMKKKGKEASATRESEGDRLVALPRVRTPHKKGRGRPPPSKKRFGEKRKKKKEPALFVSPEVDIFDFVFIRESSRHNLG